MITTHKHKGFALISVLLLVAFAAFVLTDMVKNQHRMTKKQNFFLLKDQVISLAIGAEEWISVGLAQAGKVESATGLNQLWAQYVPPLPFEGGSVGGYSIDLNRYFNINNLMDENTVVRKQWLAIWQRYSEQNNIPLEWTDVLLDWLDADNDPRSNGAEKDLYLLKNPPYRAANQQIAHLQELSRLEGYKKKWMESFKQHLTAVPITRRAKARININTAGKAILLALDSNITGEIATEIINYRTENLFRTTNQFRNFLASKLSGITAKQLNATLSDSIIGFKSNYFLLNAQIEYGDYSNAIHVVFYRNRKNKVSVLYRWIRPLESGEILLPDFSGDDSNTAADKDTSNDQ